MYLFFFFYIRTYIWKGTRKKKERGQTFKLRLYLVSGRDLGHQSNLLKYYYTVSKMYLAMLNA